MNLKGLGIAALVGASVIGLGAPRAHAQVSDDTLKVQKPFTVKVGAFFPSDGDVRDAVGNTFLNLGVSYDFAKTQAVNPTVFGVYVDYFAKSDDGIRLNVFAIGPQAKFYFSPATEAQKFYGGVGVGYYSVNARGGGASETKGRIGGKLMLGYEFAGGVLAEADYNFIGDVEGVNSSGAGLRLGYRF